MPFYRTFEEMTKNKDGKFLPALVCEASSCLSIVSRFDFLAALIITRHILNSTLSMTQLLQGKSIDIMDEIHVNTSLKDSVVKMRNTLDAFYESPKFFRLKLSSKVGRSYLHLISNTALHITFSTKMSTQNQASSNYCRKR